MEEETSRWKIIFKFKLKKKFLSFVSVCKDITVWYVGTLVERVEKIKSQKANGMNVHECVWSSVTMTTYGIG